MRKGRDGEKKMVEWKIMMKIVATNVVASQPPERRRTATPTACANIVCVCYLYFNIKYDTRKYGIF